MPDYMRHRADEDVVFSVAPSFLIYFFSALWIEILPSYRAISRLGVDPGHHATPPP